MDRHNFIRSQTWTFQVEVKQGVFEKLFEGPSCFTTTPFTLSTASPDSSLQFLFFDTNGSRDECQMKTEISIVKFPPTLSNEPTCLLYVVLDEVGYIIDHTQIVRIITPVLGPDLPYITIQFTNICWRVYYSGEGGDNESKFTRLNELWSNMQSSLKPMTDINVAIRQLLSRDSQEKQTIPDVSEILREKYAMWITLLNKINSYCATILNSSPSDQDIAHMLDDIGQSYLDVSLTYSDIQSMYDNTVASVSVRNFSHWIDCLEQKMEQEIESDIAKIFSFSNNLSAPSEQALAELERKMQEANELSQQSLLLSFLCQKHFCV